MIKNIKYTYTFEKKIINIIGSICRYHELLFSLFDMLLGKNVKIERFIYIRFVHCEKLCRIDMCVKFGDVQQLNCIYIIYVYVRAWSLWFLVGLNNVYGKVKGPRWSHFFFPRERRLKRGEVGEGWRHLFGENERTNNKC